MFERKSKVCQTHTQKNGLFHRTASSCIRRLLFTLGEARGIHGFSPRPRISDISSSLCLSDEIDITIISALSPHRPIFKCRPFHTSQWSIMQAGRQAGNIQRYRSSSFSLSTRQTPRLWSAASEMQAGFGSCPCLFPNARRGRLVYERQLSRPSCTD